MLKKLKPYEQKLSEEMNNLLEQSKSFKFYYLKILIFFEGNKMETMKKRLKVFSNNQV
jgi:hypothetical protein